MLTHPVVEAALAAAHPAGVEAQHREAAIHEDVEQREDDLVVHRPAILRMGMKNQRDGRMFFLALVIAAFQTALGAGEHHIRHLVSGFAHYWPPVTARRSCFFGES
jgi:hypothetical protein